MPDDYDLVPVDDQPQFADIPTPKTGQIVQPVTVGQDIASMPGKVAGVAGQLTGVSDAARALRGQMTPEEAQTFALGAIPALAAGPEAEIAEEAAPEVANAVTQGIRAFHGSPYDFNQFDLSKIGTGEGAQSYGHGLYFAENPGTAKAYRDQLSGGYNDSNNGLVTHGDAWETLKQAGHSGGQFHPDQTGQMARNVLNDVDKYGINKVLKPYDSIDDAALDYAGGNQQFAKGYSAILSKAQELGLGKQNPGKMYEVNINADPEHFLDWDKPLSEQSPVVKDVFGKIVPAPGTSRYLDDTLLAAPTKTGSEYKATMGRVYQSLGLGDQRSLSQKLSEAGIPGIKYLDQGSRGTGQGTSNYVVFNDKLIDIVKKYGLAGVIAGGASHFQTTPVDYNPFPEDQSKMASGGRLVAAEPNIISSHAYNKRAA